MDKSLRIILTGYLYLTTQANEALQINELAFLTYHVLKNNNQLLLLNCSYTVDDDTNGLILKWYFNSIIIYQWIPSKLPYVFSDFKSRVDTTYQSSDDYFKKYSTLALTNVTVFDTGNYSCGVETSQSYDKKTAQLIIIDPKISMDLTSFVDDIEQIVYVECSILNIYDTDVKILVSQDGKDSSISFDKYELSKINKYTAKINIQELSDQSTFTCLASFNEIDYEMRKSIIYREMKSSFDPEKVIRLFSNVFHSYKEFMKFYFD